MRSLENRIVVVTGASRGIGEGIVRLFAREKARVVLVARSRRKLESVAEAVIFLAKQNKNAWTSMADIRPLAVKK